MTAAEAVKEVLNLNYEEKLATWKRTMEISQSLREEGFQVSIGSFPNMDEAVHASLLRVVRAFSGWYQRTESKGKTERMADIEREALAYLVSQ